MIRTAKIFIPTRSKTFTGNRDFIKELSVVGLPDEDGGEKIAALVVPDYEKDIALSRAETNKKIEEHFREVSAGLAVFQARQSSASHAF